MNGLSSSILPAVFLLVVFCVLSPTYRMGRAYIKGKRAFRTGAPNPYRPGTDEAILWQFAYNLEETWAGY
jgi:hypothetical protein